MNLASKNNLKTIKILGVPVHNVTSDEVLDLMDKMISSRRPHHIVTVNPEFLVIANSDADFKKILASADLALADGVGLQFAALLQGKRFVERVAGTDLVYKLAPVAEKKGWSLFFLGAAPGVAQKAARRLKKEYPRLKIIVDESDPTPEGSKKALKQIKETQPDILFVAYGAPTQDRWIAKRKTELNVPVMIGVGGALDFIAGEVPRAPLFLRKMGLEWLYRLIKEPRRWHRQLRLPKFVSLVIAEQFSIKL
jgi:N-acetylglucosaminyldiphosphoundecaprenol N-acetyl-beta-D-mannosaminyltransferase